MSDDQSDSWRFLADELGVDPDKQPAPPPAPAANQPAAKHHSPPSSVPQKKSKADWNALAGELGLEVPSQSESESAHDHVAELLGFPPPGSFSSEHDEPQNRDQGEDYHNEYGEESAQSSGRDRWRDEDEQQRRSNMYDDTKPVYDDAHSADFEEPQPPADYRDPPHAGAHQNYRSGGRRRGGRGRGRGGRGGDRGGEGRGRYGNQNRQRDSYGNRPYGQQNSDRPPQFDEYADEERPSFSEGPVESAGNERSGNERSDNERSDNERSDNERSDNERSDNERSSGDDRSGDDRPRRRRRGGRGRGGRGRGGRSDRPQQRPPMNREQSDRPVDDHDLPYLDPIDESLLADEHGASMEFETIDFTAAESTLGTRHEEFDNESSGSTDSMSRMADQDDEHDDHDLAGIGDADDSHDESSGKASVRDILTWKEAIGMIVDGNMQSRANSPHPAHHPRGQRGGRGRGRGRGGHRR